MVKSKGTMSQTEKMDKLIRSSMHEIDQDKLVEIINKVFGIDLVEVSNKGEGRQPHSYAIEVQRDVARKLHLNLNSTLFVKRIQTIDKIDLLFLYMQGKEWTGSSIRKAINEVFGINLDGISSLQHAGISIFSKGQWIIRNDMDLVVVQTGPKDATASIYPTDVYKSNVKWRHSLEQLHVSLLELGFTYVEEMGVYEYADPQGESISDHLKTAIFSTVSNIIASVDTI